MVLYFLALILLIITVWLLLTKVETGILWLFPVMGVVDTTWSMRYGGISLIQVISAIVPLCILLHTRKLRRCPAWWMNLAKTALICNVAGLIWAKLYDNFSVQVLIDVPLRAVNIYIGFFMLPMFFNTPKKFRKLLYCFMFASLFPLLVQGYQIVSGETFGHLRETRGIMRMVGLYHDAVTNKIFFLQALGAGVLLLGGRLERRKTFQILILVWMAVLLCGCYNLFSKSTVAVLLLWAIGLAVLGKKIHWLVWGVVLLLFFNHYTHNAVFDNVYEIFERDIAVQQGQLDTKYTLSGRGMIWEEFWAYFVTEGGITGQIFGYGINMPVHNEWFRIMIFGGYLSLAVFLLFQIKLLRLLWVRIFRKWNFRNVFLLLLFLSYLIDCIGITPGLYPQYNWYLWGVMGCIFFMRKRRRRRGKRKHSRRRVFRLIPIRGLPKLDFSKE